ncbi:hypothetical protein NC653_002555 [Populus alba x Populus x berolinensis]|uniref:Uncharacterized protein n=1 Tax=Populus alba x Populus x berolinensis TaxID=444605 RepID=A0AAD6RP63_9ROSI|nr:hypothetical protein NC653_002555 [Populus alba x Populus x berolinensis]
MFYFLFQSFKKKKCNRVLILAQLYKKVSRIKLKTKKKIHCCNLVICKRGNNDFS